MSDQQPGKRSRRVVRKGTERPYEDPTSDDEPDPQDQDDSGRDRWLKDQKPPHHG